MQMENIGSLLVIWGGGPHTISPGTSLHWEYTNLQTDNMAQMLHHLLAVFVLYFHNSVSTYILIY